jgi:hypothetical protein
MPTTSSVGEEIGASDETSLQVVNLQKNNPPTGATVASAKRRWVLECFTLSEYPYRARMQLSSDPRTPNSRHFSEMPSANNGRATQQSQWLFPRGVYLAERVASN